MECAATRYPARTAPHNALVFSAAPKRMLYVCTLCRLLGHGAVAERFFFAHTSFCSEEHCITFICKFQEARAYDEKEKKKKKTLKEGRAHRKKHRIGVYIVLISQRTPCSHRPAMLLELLVSYHRSRKKIPVEYCRRQGLEP